MLSKEQDIAQKLGIVFHNTELLKQALHHRSMRAVSNERLEFLGDAILNFIIADELYHLYPESTEGELSRLRANLVNSKVLSSLAEEIDLGAFLYLGEGERKSGGEKRPSILADAFEAIIGAVFLDSDIAVCKKHVLRWYKTRLRDVMVLNKDPKSELQEFLQAQKLPLPKYEIEKITGEAHAQIFYVSCEVLGVNVCAYGEGLSRREAEQEAAAEFLKKIRETEVSS